MDELAVLDSSKRAPPLDQLALSSRNAASKSESSCGSVSIAHSRLWLLCILCPSVSPLTRSEAKSS